MSRIGKHPVEVPSGVDVKLDGQVLTAKGSLGEMSLRLHDEVAAKLEDGKVTVSPKSNSRVARQQWATARTNIFNLVSGVSTAFEKKLELRGVGYRAQVQGKNLVMSLGYSHDVVYPMPEGITIACPNQTEIVVSGADKQKVGQVAAEIRSKRTPEPYKGKGVRYDGEYVLIKEGKKK
ncbi:MAG: 50S ribosomal protein L6 [Alphaproteobacteria bacterium]